jgi:hypothetical protein
MTPEDQDLVRSRQRGRALVMALLLCGFAILVFFITIAKLKTGAA